MTPYLRTALERAAATVANAAPGGRNETLNRESYGLGQLIHAGLSVAEAEAVLTQSASLAGLPTREALTTIRHALREGQRRPRVVPQREVSARTPADIAQFKALQRDARRAREAEALATLDAADATAEATQTIWKACRPVDADAEACAWLSGRGLDVDRVAALEGVRSCPDGPVFWTGRRLVLSVYDCRGARVAVRGRATSTVTHGSKENGPTGHNGVHPDGRVYACPLARRMLAGDAVAVAEVRRVGVVFTEGGPDWLTASTAWSDADERAPAVLGLYPQSSPAPAVTARIPDGARVVLVPHAGDAGTKYMADVIGAVRARCVVFVAETGAGDLNDLLQTAGRAGVRDALTGAEVYA
jgi:hypothetical protein